MHHELFLELSLVLIGTGIVAAFIKTLRQPLIIGYIFAGLILGPYALNIIQSGDILSSLSQFGIALLLFIIGLGLNPAVLKEVGKTALFVGVGQILFTTVIASVVGLLLGFDPTATLLIAVSLAFSSTIIVLKILSDKKETSALYGKISTGFLLVQDVVATIALIVLAGFGGEESTISALAVTTTYAIGLSLILILLARFVLPLIGKFLASSQEFLFLFSLTWGFGIAAVFVKAGLSVEVGALFAGVALASQPYAQEMSSRLRPLRDFFIIIFFIVLGAELELTNLPAVILPALAFSAVVLFGNPIIVTSIMGVLGYTKRTSFKTGLTVSQISEFSLIFILLGGQLGIANEETVAIVTLVALITITGSTYFMLFDNGLFKIFEKPLSFFERKKIREKKGKYGDTDIFLFGYAQGGQELVSTFRKLNKSFLVLDYNPSAVEELIDNNIPFVYGDMTDVEFLEEVGADRAKIVVSTVRDSNTNRFILNHVRSRNNRAVIVVQSESSEEAEYLYQEGATYVMMPHYISSERLSHMLRKKGIKKSDFTPARERHIRYIKKHL